MNYIVNGVTKINGVDYWRIDNLEEGLQGVEFLAKPFILVRDRDTAIRIVKLLNTKETDEVRSH